MTDEIKGLLGLVIVFFLIGYSLGYVTKPTSKYGYGRNPYRRYCGECGQQQIFDLNEDGSGTRLWVPNGKMRRPGCECNDKVPSGYFPNKNPNAPGVSEV